ncbi:MAG: putative glycoside hydrolase [Planctomycetota bacterium]
MRNSARLDFAAQYDLIVGGVLYDAQDELKYIKSKNPDIIILKYLSLRGGRPTDKHMKPEWWITDPGGKPIQPWPGVALLNQTRPDLNAYLIYQAKLVLEKQPLFDGIFLDSFESKISYLNGGKLDANHDRRADDKDWLDEEWKKGLLRVAEGIRNLRDGKVIVMANGWDPLDFGFEYLNGCLLEDAVVRVAEGRGKWDELMGGYLRWFEVLRKPRVTGIVSGGGAISDPWEWNKLSQAERDAEAERARNNLKCMRFGLCATLMGDGYYGYDYQTVCRGQYWWYKEFDAPLGYPRGTAFARPDGAWQREYDGGSVVVNPTLEPVTVTFAAPQKDATSDAVGTEMTVEPRDGRIFLVTERTENTTKEKDGGEK